MNLYPILLLIFVFCFLIPFLALRKLKKTYPETFDRYKNTIYSTACLLLTVIFSVRGVKGEATLPATITLASAAFFATSFIFTLRQGPSSENKFGMLHLMVFMTFLALGLGCRTIFG